MTSQRLQTDPVSFDMLESMQVGDWDDIDRVLDSLRQASPAQPVDPEGFSRLAFMTFDFGLDMVARELYKYAACLQGLFHNTGVEPDIHFIGNDFSRKSDALMDSSWTRFRLSNTNGWAKWDGGKWFTRLYYDSMPEDSDESRQMAVEIWQQALCISRELSAYILDNRIGLLITANINSNPGNLATALASVLASEVLGVPVLNFNHDFYWEGGKAAWQKADDEDPGIRDHFFRNESNQSFFAVFSRLLPWDGARWLQINVHCHQSATLKEFFRFNPDKVFEVGTAIRDQFFEPHSPAMRERARTIMQQLLADGQDHLRSISVSGFRQSIDEWIIHQRPICVGAETNQLCRYADPNTLVFLQPTRITTQKQIQRNWDLVESLMQSAYFRQYFDALPDRQLILHVSGPLPIEHQEDLAAILEEFQKMLQRCPDIAGRVFIAFSVGTTTHPSFVDLGVEPMSVKDLYMLSDLALLPSDIEGRGLPLIESSACGIPIVCRRFKPADVFSELVGEQLPEEDQIRYVEFRDAGFRDEECRLITELLFDPAVREDLVCHNYAAVQKRYAMPALQMSFVQYLKQLQTL